MSSQSTCLPDLPEMIASCSEVINCPKSVTQRSWEQQAHFIPRGVLCEAASFLIIWVICSPPESLTGEHTAPVCLQMATSYITRSLSCMFSIPCTLNMRKHAEGWLRTCYTMCLMFVFSAFQLIFVKSNETFYSTVWLVITFYRQMAMTKTKLLKILL